MNNQDTIERNYHNVGGKTVEYYIDKKSGKKYYDIEYVKNGTSGKITTKHVKSIYGKEHIHKRTHNGKKLNLVHEDLASSLIINHLLGKYKVKNK
jgi:hypothetical protein